MLIKPQIETDITAKYNKYRVSSKEEVDKLFNQDNPVVCVIDSETSGLHIKKDEPFMWVFGWLTKKSKRSDGIKGKVLAFEHDEDLLRHCLELSKETNYLVGHNMKYDLHMCINGGIGQEEITERNDIYDTMAVLRLSFESVAARDGGEQLGLKKVSKKYIDERADEFEQEVKKELKKINDQKRKVLKDKLKEIDGWSLKKLEQAYKVKTRDKMKIFTTERKWRWIEVPENVEKMYKDWIKEYPPATYGEVDRDIMMEYVHSDGIYTLEIFERYYPKVLKMKQYDVLKRESELKLVLLKMERVGLKVDTGYLNKCDSMLEEEILKGYKELWNIVGDYFTTSQDQVILDYYEEKLGYRPETSDKSFLKKQKNDRVAQLIMRLRRLEKWQSTYISKVKEVSEYDGYFYTQYGQYGAVSGRLTSDAQQFPKERILTEEGEEYEDEHGEGKAPQSMEIFFPRRAFVPHGNGYDKIAYFDQQVELKLL